jgi:uncharacterized membrane protein YfcA
MPWWVWSLLLFGFTIVLGIVAVIAGIGGGVLFVPIVSALFPFHFDFVRGAGLMVALCGAMSAGPRLLSRGLASVKLALPLVLFGSVGGLAGAAAGLALPETLVQTLLGFTVLGIVGLMLSSRRSELSNTEKPDRLAEVLLISGVYREESIGEDVNWTVHRTWLGMIAFIFIGFMAGMFGLGAGWASVPTLRLVLGAPLKVAIATSGFILVVNGAAAWVYLNSAAVLPLIAVPSVAGMMIGTNIGARLLPGMRPKFAKWIVIGILFITGLRYVLVGLGVMR